MRQLSLFPAFFRIYSLIASYGHEHCVAFVNSYVQQSKVHNDETKFLVKSA